MGQHGGLTAVGLNRLAGAGLLCGFDPPPPPHHGAHSTPGRVHLATACLPRKNRPPSVTIVAGRRRDITQAWYHYWMQQAAGAEGLRTRRRAVNHSRRTDRPYVL